MQTEVTTALMNEVIDMRNAVCDLLRSLLGKDVKLYHRAIAISPFLLELHIDFETVDRSVWMTFTQDKVIKVVRDFRDTYRRDHSEVSFGEADTGVDWLRKLVLDR